MGGALSFARWLLFRTQLSGQGAGPPNSSLSGAGDRQRWSALASRAIDCYPCARALHGRSGSEIEQF